MIIAVIMVLQLVIFALCLRIMCKFPSSANVAFYVSAHLMIVKLLADQVCQNYKVYRDDKPFSLQSQYFCKLTSIFLFFVVVFAFNGCVAYASNE